jgi:16S rRNA (guanine527-N7)-methyltransferase
VAERAAGTGPAPDRVQRRLAQLASEHGLTPAQRDQLGILLAALDADEHAPTAVRERELAVDVHVADSLSALAVPALVRARRIVDMGSGAGLPGLPLAVALPAAHVTLLESGARKALLLEALARRMGLANVSVAGMRVESWRAGVGGVEAVVARALAPQPVVLEYGAPLLAEGGSLVDWRGRRDAEQERAAQRAARELGLRLVEIRAVEPFARASEHHLHVFAKAAATPARFPRRPGVARKRPLG